MRRCIAIVLWVLVLSLPSALLAQESRDAVPLSDWPVSFEQIRGKVMETEPGRIAERSLHPSVNAVPSAASHFITVVPCRIVDTRNPVGPFGGPAFASMETRNYAIPSGPCSGIPTAVAYSLNFTIVNYDASAGQGGFVTAFPSGGTRPFVSTVNFGSGSNAVANAAVVPANGGSISVFSSGLTNLIIDINGYFVEGVVTNIVAGSGLSGGGTGNDVGLSVATGGITNAHIDPGAGIEESKLALNNSTHTNANDPTANEKAALGGTSGAPGAANKFVTDLDARNSNARTPLVHASSAHDATVASRVGGVVPPAQLGTGPTAYKFLQGDGAFAVPAAVRLASWGMAPQTITTTASELQGFTATFPANGAALFLFSAQFNNPGGFFPPNYVSCTLWEGTTQLRSWTMDPGDGDGYMDEEQTMFTNQYVAAGSHTYSMKCSTNTSQAQAQMGDVVVLFFRTSI